MALGKLATRNLLPLLTLGGTAGSAALPLANIMANATAVSPRHLTKPMRQTNIATLSANVILITFDRPRGIDLIGILFHTLSLKAKIRVTIAGAGGSLSTPVYQSGWIRVHPRRYRSLSLPWNAANLWCGQALLADVDVFRRHRFLSLDAPLSASAVQIEIDDRDNAAGFYDIGNLYLSRTWKPVLNFDRGRRLGQVRRSKIEEAPSGRRFAEERMSRRRTTATWSGLTSDEALRLYDDCARVNDTDMVAFIPDSDDVAGSAREAYPATLVQLGEIQFTYERQHSVTMTFEEIIA
ncbi:hypothetical protein [Caulobacter sp. BP25]|uniref:hypothetical protein n=1 Tax=Caulobacter sp. BP25 TaxID=2048900 RepID=UPI000C12B065|nr:hypothetical protein [Caulobacter sp. BP25]PHY20820.1 hypothetical protein CSW59_06240 [Caulobacter sp. BP25]